MRYNGEVTHMDPGATQTYYGCVIWGKLLNFGVPQLSHCKTGMSPTSQGCCKDYIS